MMESSYSVKEILKKTLIPLIVLVVLQLLLNGMRFSLFREVSYMGAFLIVMIPVFYRKAGNKLLIGGAVSLILYLLCKRGFYFLNVRVLGQFYYELTESHFVGVSIEILLMALSVFGAFLIAAIPTLWVLKLKLRLKPLSWIIFGGYTLLFLVLQLFSSAAVGNLFDSVSEGPNFFNLISLMSPSGILEVIGKVSIVMESVLIYALSVRLVRDNQVMGES